MGKQGHASFLQERHIKEIFLSKETQAQLAKKFRVSTTTISAIKTRKHYARVTANLDQSALTIK